MFLQRCKERKQISTVQSPVSSAAFIPTLPSSCTTEHGCEGPSLLQQAMRAVERGTWGPSSRAQELWRHSTPFRPWTPFLYQAMIMRIPTALAKVTSRPRFLADRGSERDGHANSSNLSRPLKAFVKTAVTCMYTSFTRKQNSMLGHWMSMVRVYNRSQRCS